MPSSIFNSNPAARAPSQKWAVVWPAALCLALLVAGMCEFSWRSRGHLPSVVDSPALWSYHRRRVAHDESQVVLLGASRMQVGFSTDVFRDRFPMIPVTMLAVDGRYPISVLRELSRDETFHGVVICSIHELSFCSEHLEDQQEYVDYYDELAPNQMLEPMLSASFQEQFVILNPSVSLKRVVVNVLGKGRLPEPAYLVTRFDRSRIADYSLLDIDAHRRARLKHRRDLFVQHRKMRTWSENAAAAGSLVTRIHDRGGAVVFVRFPTTGQYWEMDAKEFPKHECWDRLASLTNAETIHFRDVPDLAHFDCPDTSHLDLDDSRKFTVALLDALVARGYLPEDNGNQSIGATAK